MSEAIIFDTETTGLEEPEVIQAAWLPFHLGETRPGAIASANYKPTKRISLGALATHHIMDEDLVDCEPCSSFRLPDGVRYLIGYNVDFDWRAIGSPELKRIDVLSMCRTLWPEADSHTQSAMLYLLEREVAREALRSAHDAAHDVDICRVLLQHAIAKGGPFDSIEALWQFSERARIPTVMPYGKHKGMPIRQVPPDYKRWLLNQQDVDPYLVKALRGA